MRRKCTNVTFSRSMDNCNLRVQRSPFAIPRLAGPAPRSKISFSCPANRFQGLQLKLKSLLPTILLEGIIRLYESYAGLTITVMKVHKRYFIAFRKHMQSLIALCAVIKTLSQYELRIVGVGRFHCGGDSFQ